MILLALNELNINYVKEYIKIGELVNFQTLLDQGLHETTSEDKYELLEPWIQWTTLHTGLSYDEHKVLRLGDITNRKDLVQIFEKLESKNLSVGAISPFNADNRLKNSKFFIPDPWTQTKSSGGFLISKLSMTISRIVNSNASGGASFIDFIWLLLGFISFVRLKRWINFIKMIFIFKKPGVKAAILDMILLEVFVTLQKKNKPDYSHLFFNGGAHVQHHYLFNSGVYDGPFKNPEWYCPKDWDPLLMMLKSYDRIIGDLLESGERIIGVTGLHQNPHGEKTFYWRPINHKDFLLELGIDVKFEVIPRMSRDFLIETNSEDDSTAIEKILNSYKDSDTNKNVFSIDNRGSSLFVEIIYSNDVTDDLQFLGNNKVIQNLKNKLAFVAIKNGKHDGLGYVFSNKDLNCSKKLKLKDLHEIIINFAISDYEKSNK